MSDYTAAEIEEATQKYRQYSSYSQGWVEEDGGFWHEVGYSRTKIILRGEEVEVECVEDFGGGEGSGEERWVVVQIGDQLFRKTGWYASHYGSEFDGDLEEVEAYQKTITAYRPV